MTQAKLTLNLIKTLLVHSGRKGISTWLLSEPYNLLVIDVRENSTGRIQVLLSAYGRSYWETVNTTDKIFNA